MSGEPDAYLLDLLVRMRNVYVLELRRRAFDRLPEPTRLLLEVDEALGIANHQDYDYLDLRVEAWFGTLNEDEYGLVHSTKGELRALIDYVRETAARGASLQESPVP